MIKLKSLYNEIKLISNKEKRNIEKTLKILKSGYNIEKEDAIEMLRTSGAPELKKQINFYYPKKNAKK